MQDAWHIRDLVVPTDFSEAAPGVLRQAFALARAGGARVHVLHVMMGFWGDAFRSLHHTPNAAVTYGVADDVVRCRMTALIDGAEPGGLVVMPVKLHGRSVAGAVMGYAYEVAADLIVLRRGRRRRVGTSPLGAVPRELMRQVRQDVLVLAGDRPDFFPVRVVLAPRVGSMPSAAEARADVLAAQWQARCVVLPVEPPPEEGPLPAGPIVEAARTHGADLIVAAAAGWRAGRLAEAVVRAAPCPVLLVHA